MGNIPYSHIIKATEMWTVPITSKPPGGIFGQVVSLHSVKGIQLVNHKYTMEFDIPFDDDFIPNEGKISIFNLTKDTAMEFKAGNWVELWAGYRDDIAIIFVGTIQKVVNRYVGPDKITVIYGVDSGMAAGSKIQKYENMVTDLRVALSYTGGMKASFILEDLVRKTAWPIGEFCLVKDYTFINPVVVEGDLNENIARFAQLCGATAFIEKGVLFVKDGKSHPPSRIRLNRDTGLLGDPEEFIQDNGEGTTERGYKARMLLDYRVAPGTGILLETRQESGSYVVRRGRHVYDGKHMTTQVTMIRV